MNKYLAGMVLVAGAPLLSADAAGQIDPGATGPFPVTMAEYSAPNEELGGDNVEVEILARVHRPTSLSNGPYPLVLFLHGQHSPCYVVATSDGSNAWPCTASGLASVPSYQGYDYVASTLASHGMIVASISANGINAFDEWSSPSVPHIEERRLLIQHHIDKWVTFNSTGGAPFGTTFAGKVDLQRVAMVGHSRGGAAVLSYVASAPSGLRAVLAIAPTGRGLATPLSNVPLAILTGYCDGDESDLHGLGYVDQARYAIATDNANKYTILGFGANHNYFNSVWGPSFPAGRDDWRRTADPHCGTDGDRLSESEQRGLGRAYIAAFLRKHLLGANQFDAILNGDALPPPSAQTDDVYIGYLPGAHDRKDLNRLFTSGEATTNTLGGSVTASGLTATPCGISSRCVASNRETHWPISGTRLTGVLLEWNALNGTYTNALPIFKRDISNFTTLQFRVAVDYTDADNTVGQAQDFSIKLTDAVGRTSTVKASDYSEVLYYPPGAIAASLSNGRAAVMNSLRVPLEAFGNIDRTNVASVTLLFNRTSKGRIVVSDIAFAEEGTTAGEKWLVSNSFSF